MKRIILVAVVAATAACSAPAIDPNAEGTSAGTSSALAGAHVTLSPAASYGGRIDASGDAVDVYYPRRAYGQLPVVVLLQGANVDKAEYATYASDVARFGFVVLVPNHVSKVLPGLFSSEEVVTQAFAFAIAEGARDGSPIFGKVDGSALALLGHSFGGAIGLLAIGGTCAPPFCTPGAYVRPDALKAAAFWGTNLVQNGQLFPVDTSAAAVALLQGDDDGRAHPADGVTTFLTLATPKAYITFAGANHYGITNDNDPAGAIPDPNAPTISQRQSIEETSFFAGLFLRAHVQHDEGAAWLLTHAGGAFPGVHVETVN
jgi:dienelactone hydrolase